MGRYDSLLEKAHPSASSRTEGTSAVPREDTASSLRSPQQVASKDNPVNQPASQSTDESTNQSTGQPTEYATGPSVRSPIDESPILGRPKAFYITKRQDEAIDRAVHKLSEKLEGVTNLKVDRSTVIRALLDTTDMAGEATIERLADNLVNQLVSRLTGRPPNQSHGPSIK